MSQLTSFVLLAIAHFITGRGIMRLFRADDDFRITVPVSLITGVGIASFLPFLLQLLHISITPSHVFTSIGLVAALAAVPLLIGWRQLKRPQFRVPRLYDLPFLVCTAFIIFLSVWRCYYNPVTPRDMLSGPEVIADYTVREHSLVNSVFSLDLFGNNNQFKPPSVTSLQVIYKMAGFPFGQVWLSIIFIAFLLFLYQVLTRRIHSIIAGLLILIFLAIPEMFAYTYIALFDYTNTVFFTLSCYFLFAFFDGGRRTRLLLAGLFMGLATYFRAETVILAAMLAPAILVFAWRRKAGALPALGWVALFLIIPIIGYWLPNSFYNNHYLPVHYDIKGLVNEHPFQLGGLVERFTDMNTKLMFGDFSILLYGYIIYLFIGITLLELILNRRFTEQGRNWQYAVLVIYIGLPLMGFLLPLMDLMNTTKRGMFKIFPLMILYMSNCRPLIRFSEKIWAWENGPAGKPEAAPVQQKQSTPPPPAPVKPAQRKGK